MSVPKPQNRQVGVGPADGVAEPQSPASQRRSTPSASSPHSTPALRTPMARVWFWIDKFASEESLQGRGNDEYWSIKFRGSDLWNLRQAVESLEEQLEAANELLSQLTDYQVAGFHEHHARLRAWQPEAGTANRREETAPGDASGGTRVSDSPGVSSPAKRLT